MRWKTRPGETKPDDKPDQTRRDKMRWKTRPGETKPDDKPDQTRQNEMRKPDQAKKKNKTKQTTTTKIN